MKQKLLCPSMMCANYTNLAAEIKELDQAGTDIFHVDIMDGSFVPNFAMGTQDIACIRAYTKKPIDVHLMAMNPYQHINILADLGVNIIHIHSEADLHPARTLDAIKARGLKAGIAVNPGTSFESVKELLPLCDYVLLMTVNPGFAGQAFLPYTLEKAGRFVEAQKKLRYTLIADGALSPLRIEQLFEIGVEGFVLGTSAMFGKGKSYAAAMAELR